MKNVIFPVSKIATNEGFLPSGYSSRSGITHAIVDEETEKVLHYCSKDYALIKNQDIITSFEEFLTKKGYKYELYTQSFDGVRFRLQFALLNRKANVQVGDIVAPSLVIDNSYNGSLRYRFLMSILRLICLNGLTTTLDSKHLNMLHTPGADEGIAVEKSLKLIEEFLPLFDDAIEPYYDLAEQVIDPTDVEDRVNEIIEETAFPIGLRDDVLAQIQKEVIKLGVDPNDWLVYNGFNYMLQHVTENYLGRKADKIDRQILDYVLAY